MQLRGAVVSLFSERSAFAIDQLRELTAADWQRNRLWLDRSGMALYFLARLHELDAEGAIPIAVLERLRINLAQNRKRTSWLFTEMATINAEFERAGVRFAHLKGLTLVPESVPDPCLRFQSDLDFLVSAKTASAAQMVLERLGYRLSVISGNVWEFRAGDSRLSSIHDLYKVRPHRSVELHVVDLPATGAAESMYAAQLLRSQPRRIRGVAFPTLAPPDQFLNQASHLFKHFQSESTRTSWALELARHLAARHADADFWHEVKRIGCEHPEAPLALGVALHVVEEIFGMNAPQTLGSWTVDLLPPGIALWAEVYGGRAALAEPPGSKLYLLLAAELPACGSLSNAPAGKHWVPLKLPKMITTAEPGDSFLRRLERYAEQASYVLYRLRFHLREGLRYRRELKRWRRLKQGLSD